MGNGPRLQLAIYRAPVSVQLVIRELVPEAACEKWVQLVLYRAADWDQLVNRELIPEAACEKWVQLVIYRASVWSSWFFESS